MKVLDEHTIGFADYSGNRQYVSTGNFSTDNRVAVFFMDYPNRTRLKMLGAVRSIGRLRIRFFTDNGPGHLHRRSYATWCGRQRCGRDCSGFSRSNRHRYDHQEGLFLSQGNRGLGHDVGARGDTGKHVSWV